jgi:squalene-hopene/tetraprenyl-beta-curcumene cyclase
VNDRLRAALATAEEALLAEREECGAWVGELSSSALSTATATIALASVDPAFHRGRINAGLDWLVAHRNADGGWGDTTRSRSNLSTTALVWAALGMAPHAAHYGTAGNETAAWLSAAITSTGTVAQGGNDATPRTAQLIATIEERYGKDRTFSIPIIMTLALAGRLGRDGWRQVRSLPFELAAFPPRFFGALRLPVVSYALPALIAIGQAIHHHAPSRNPVVRTLRDLVRDRTLHRLIALQPVNGGFLEATPLTSFVTMSLASMGLASHQVAQRGVEFLCASMRADGSWPIDTNLSTWLTTQAIVALGSNGFCGNSASVRDWLLRQQNRARHPYTNAPPGGWAWTDLPGGVPDADDTAGALLALRALGPPWDQHAIVSGIQWLIDLQNRDGGIPTFCRGWGTLPFDRSSADLTAHALRAWCAWNAELPRAIQDQTARATSRAIEYLGNAQRRDGSWVPLWFGNENVADENNPTYGTARVLTALHDLQVRGIAFPKEVSERGAAWLARAQKTDGSWGGDAASPTSVEETALAVEALAPFRPEEAARGAEWLIARVEDGTWRQASPIGFYFARLWYFERLYPLIHTIAALRAMTGETR